MNKDKPIELTIMASIMIKAISGETNGKKTKDNIIKNILRKVKKTSISKVNYCHRSFKFVVYDYSTYQLIDFDPRM